MPNFTLRSATRAANKKNKTKLISKLPRALPTPPPAEAVAKDTDS